MPAKRQCKRPTTEQILRLFTLVQHHRLVKGGQPVQRFEAELSDLQRQVLKLLGVNENVYRY